jgi:hypothetical protein
MRLVPSIGGLIDFIMDNQNKPQKTQKKRPIEDLSDEEISTTDDRYWPKFLLIEATDKDKPLSKLSPFAVAKAIQGIAGQPKQAKYLRSGGMLLEVTKRTHCENLLRCNMIVNIPVRIHPHKSLNSTRGVIRCNLLRDCTGDQIVEELKDQGVSHVRRILITKEGNRVPTNTLILTFMGTTLPVELTVGFMKVKVDPFIPNPMRCFKCQKFGHHRDSCRNEPKCAKCGESEHEDSDCDRPFKCINCGDCHPSFSKQCPKFKFEKEVQRVKSTNNVSFPEARRIVEGSGTHGKKTYAQAAKVSCKSQSVQTDLSWSINDGKFFSLQQGSHTNSKSSSSQTQTATVSTQPQPVKVNTKNKDNVKLSGKPTPSNDNKGSARKSLADSKSISRDQTSRTHRNRSLSSSRLPKGSVDPIREYQRVGSLEMMDVSEPPGTQSKVKPKMQIKR